MAASRLLIRPLGLATSSTTTPSSHAAVSSRHATLMCLGRSAGGRPLTASACVTLRGTDTGVDDLTSLLAHAARSMSGWRKSIAEPRQWLWGFNIQMFVEKAIVDCRFFTLLAVAGSLLASVLCFVEGCLLIVGSYLQYFRSISQILAEPGQVVVQLIEAIDMFLMGTAMLLFGMALHAMFVGQNNLEDKPSLISPSASFSNTINLNKWMGVESAMEAKSKMGRAVIMILQIQVLDKVKGIAVNNGADLACFAGVVFLCSASIFLLSRIPLPHPAQAVR